MLFRKGDLKNAPFGRKRDNGVGKFRRGNTAANHKEKKHAHEVNKTRPLTSREVFEDKRENEKKRLKKDFYQGVLEAKIKGRLKPKKRPYNASEEGTEPQRIAQAVDVKVLQNQFKKRC